MLEGTFLIAAAQIMYYLLLITLHYIHSMYMYIALVIWKEKTLKCLCFLFYRNGKVKYKYGGENSKDGIIKWLRK